MRARWFTLGVLVGLAPRSGQVIGRMLHDCLAATIDLVLRFDLDTSSPAPRT